MTDSSHSNSSVDIISSISCSATETSEDEVVWGVSDEYSSDSSGSDYVLLPHTLRTPDHDSDDSVSETRLSIAFDLLSVTTSSKVDDEPDTNKVDKADQTRKRMQLRRARRKARKTNASTEPSPQSDSGTRTPTCSYEDAAAFITQYLDSPVKEDSPSAKLRLLQALIVEFGVTQQLPTSITSAKKLLKAEVHVNIKEYVAKRGKDQGALRQIMYPSKNALRKNVRRSGHKKPLKWVKKHGLHVLLIDCYN